MTNSPENEPNGAAQESPWRIPLPDIRAVLGTEVLPWPPDRITEPDKAHEAAARYKELKEGILLVTDGPTQEYADVAAQEEVMWGRRCMLESGRANDPADQERLQKEAGESFEKAGKLLAFAEGDETLADFVAAEWREERELLDLTLDTLGEAGFTPAAVNEMFVFDENDREAIEAITQKYKKLDSLRQPSVAKSNPDRPGPAETATGFEPIPADRRELIKYERRHFSEFDPAKIEQFKAYLEVRLQELFDKAEKMQRDGHTVRFPDTVAGVLGNGGEAPLFLGRALNEQLPSNERIDDLNVVLRMPFSEAAKRLGLDVVKEHPDYYKTFSKR